MLQAVRTVSKKPIKVIIYGHSHTVAGAGVLAEGNKEVVVIGHQRGPERQLYEVQLTPVCDWAVSLPRRLLPCRAKWRYRPTAVVGRPDFVAAKPPVRPLPTHLTGGFATRPAAAFLDLEMFPPAGLTTVVRPIKMPA